MAWWTKRTTKRLHVDEESRALMANPAFREALARAKRTLPEDLIDAEELDRRRPLTRDEIEAADARLDALESGVGVSNEHAPGDHAPTEAGISQ